MRWIYLHKLHIQFMGQQPEKWWLRAVARATQRRECPAPVPRSGLGSPSLQLLQKMSSLNQPNTSPFPAAAKPLALANYQKNRKKLQVCVFSDFKMFFFLWIQELLAMVMCPSLPHLQFLSLLLPQCPVPLTCLQGAGDVRKGRVCAPGAELSLLQLSQLRESSPGKGHKLGLHVQPVSKPQFILINIISAAVKLDKII